MQTTKNVILYWLSGAALFASGVLASGALDSALSKPVAQAAPRPLLILTIVLLHFYRPTKTVENKWPGRTNDLFSWTYFAAAIAIMVFVVFAPKQSAPRTIVLLAASMAFAVGHVWWAYQMGKIGAVDSQATRT